MGVTVTNLIAGPGTLYTGAFGATEPTDISSAPASATWTDAGGTQDGVEIEISQEYMELDVDQLVDIPGRRLQKREVTVKTNLAEATLANLGLALNGGTVGASAYDPADDTTATQPTYKALIIDGWAPGDAKRRRVIVRKVLSVEGLGLPYKKDGQTLIPVTFSGHYVSSSIRPFRVIDQT